MSEYKSKPEFITLDDIRPNKHCYNVYGVITDLNVEETTSKLGEKVLVATGKLADQTGCMEFKLRGEHVEGLKLNDTVAFRNGKSILIDECIHLEMDKFGRITQEPDRKVDAQPNKVNHSQSKWEKKK